MFPRDVSSIDLAYDNNDGVSEFTVTFGYSYFINDNSPTNSSAGIGGQGGMNPGSVIPGLAGAGNGFGFGNNGGGSSGFGFSAGSGSGGSGFTFGYGNGNSSFGVGFAQR